MTYSIVAADSATREVGGTGASCIGASSVRVIYGGVADHGAVHAQALLGGPGKMQAVMMIGMDVAPADIITAITATSFDGNAQRRQYGIVDLMGRSAGFTGTQNGMFADDVQLQTGTFTVSIQGNILTSRAVLDQAMAGFQGCDLADRLMRSLEAGAQNGQGDTRCTAMGIPSDSAFIQVDRPGQPEYLRIEVTDSAPASPLVMLRQQYDAWRATHPCPVTAPDAGMDMMPGDDMGGCCSASAEGSLPIAIVVALVLRTARRS